MSARNQSVLRVAIDSSLLMALIGLAFWTGGLAQKVEGMQQHAGAPVSERIAGIEAKWPEVVRRLDRIEAKLDDLTKKKD